MLPIIPPLFFSTMTTGDLQNYQWQLTWKHANRWTNPLMGWSSSADPQAQVKLNFDSKEDAIHFAKKNGWKFETRAPHALANENVEAGRNNYTHNFLTRRVELQMKAAREKGMLSEYKEFIHEGKNKSNWFMQLNYHGDGEIEQYGVKAPPSKR